MSATEALILAGVFGTIGTMVIQVIDAALRMMQ